MLLGLVVLCGVTATLLRQVDLQNEGATFLTNQLDQPAAVDGPPRRFVVRQGESAASIAERLEAEGLIQSAWSVRLLSRLRGVQGDLKAGEYELRPSMRPTEIMAVIREGRYGGKVLTIPEGWRAVEIADAVESQGIGRRAEFLELVQNGQFQHGFLTGRPANASLEGYLFPDTYRAPMDKPMAELVGEMLDTFGSRVPVDLRERATRRGLTLHETITLASIVEREARVPSEQPEIAAVFLHRLKKGMPLQADPTVQYAILPGFPPPVPDGMYWKSGLTYADLRTESPYNTYYQTGLPPGPICNPGLGSILAVLDAPETENLYFVARPDGSHAFARTLAEHNANVERYQLAPTPAAR
jgi:UPF0755 protein